MTFENDYFTKNLRSKIYTLLLHYENLRDDDKLLWIAYCQNYQGMESVVKSGDYNAFCKWLMKKNIPTFESITRARRKLQEQYIGLRGKGYVEKKASSERVRERIVHD
jgi:hypothetical protein